MIGNTLANEKKNIVVTFSLLMRLFEWCHEDAANDVAMHKVMEKLMAFSDGKNALDIQVYKSLIDGANDGEESDKESEKEYYDVSDFEGIEDATDDDLTNAYELGARQAENGMDLSNDLYRDAAVMITCDKDNGYGASNAEIEQFAKGYENCGEEKKVDHKFADYLQNLHDSYYEGGIDGEKVKQCVNDYCYDESMDNMYDYEGGAHSCHEAAPVDYEAIQAYQDQMAHCCHEGAPVDYEAIEQYQKQMDDCCRKAAPIDYPTIDQYCDSYKIPTNVLSIDSEGNIEIGSAKEEVPCEDCPEDKEIEEIVKLASF